MNAPAARPLALSLRRGRDGVIIPVRLTPKSNRDEVAGVEDHGGECVLKARVRAVVAVAGDAEVLSPLNAERLAGLA